MKVSIGKKGAGRLIALVLLGLAACVGLLSSGQASAGIPAKSSLANSPMSKVENRVLNDTLNGKSTSFIVLLSQQADLSAAYGMSDQDARGWYVYNTLRATADSSQRELRAALDRQNVSYESIWAANGLIVTGDRALVENLAARADVRRIESNAPSRGIDDPVDFKNAPLTSDNPA